MSDIKDFEFSDKNKHYYYCGNDTHVVVPDSIKIIDFTFCKCEKIKNVTIHNGIESIGELAFTYCKSLENIIIPDSVKSIGYRAFDGCSSLESIIIPDSVKSIDRFAFLGCTSLESVKIPDSVKHIGEKAFAYCNKLKCVEIPFDCEFKRNSFPVKCSVTRKNREDNTQVKKTQIEIALSDDESAVISQMADEKGISFNDELKNVFYKGLKMHISSSKKKTNNEHVREWEYGTADWWDNPVREDEDLDLTEQDRERSK